MFNFKSTLAKYVLLSYSGFLTMLLILSHFLGDDNAEDNKLKINSELKLTKSNEDYLRKAINSSFLVGSEDFKTPTTFSNDFPLSGSLIKPAPLYKTGKIPYGRKLHVGVYSWYFENDDQLVKFLQTLIESLLPEHEQICGIIVFLGDDRRNNFKIIEKMKSLQNKFSSTVKTGILEIIVPPFKYYPTDWVELLNRNKITPIGELKKTSKEILDQCYLMMYSYYKRSEYYFTANKNVEITFAHLKKITKNFESLSSRKWIYIKSKGYLFRSFNLPILVSYLRVFWTTKSLELLLTDFARTLFCDHDISNTVCKNQSIFI